MAWMRNTSRPFIPHSIDLKSVINPGHIFLGTLMGGLGPMHRSNSRKGEQTPSIKFGNDMQTQDQRMQDIPRISTHDDNLRGTLHGKGLKPNVQVAVSNKASCRSETLILHHGARHSRCSFAKNTDPQVPALSPASPTRSSLEDCPKLHIPPPVSTYGPSTPESPEDIVPPCSPNHDTKSCEGSGMESLIRKVEEEHRVIAWRPPGVV